MEDQLLSLSVLAGIGAVGVIAILYVVSVSILHQVALHELRVETERLRAEYTRRVAELRHGRIEEVDIVENEAPARGKAA